MRLGLAGTLCVFCVGASSQTFDPEAATQALLAATPTADVERVNAYVDTGYVIMALDAVAAIFFAWLVLSSGWSRNWRDLAERKLRMPFAQAFVYVPIYALVSMVLFLPLSWFSEFFTEHKFGLATQSLASWFLEHLIETAVGALMLSLFVALLYALIRRARGNWWAWGAGLSVAFMIFALLISPLFIQPLFNDYRPMDEGPLKERILSIARANGMQADDVKQFDASRQTNRVSANVSGIFGSSRIALNDNLLNRADAAAVEAVMAHEIGHFVLNHVSKMLLAFLPLLVVIFLLTQKIFDAIVRRRGDKWGIRGVDDYAGFPLLMAIISLLFFLATPVLKRVVYMQEYEADLFAINATQNPEAWAEVALLTAEYRKLQPPAWEENWLNDHPSPYKRISMAMRWKLENLPEEGLESR